MKKITMMVLILLTLAASGCASNINELKKSPCACMDGNTHNG